MKGIIVKNRAAIQPLVGLLVLSSVLGHPAWAIADEDTTKPIIVAVPKLKTPLNKEGASPPSAATRAQTPSQMSPRDLSLGQTLLPSSQPANRPGPGRPQRQDGAVP